MLAGLTVGAMLIPQSMGYAALAGLAPQYGFYAVIGALVVYAFFGTSRHLGVGPEPGTALLAASGVAAIAGGDGARYVTLMAALAMVVAAVCLVAWALRLGYLASMLSKPVLVGYITGVGLTLVSSQLSGLTAVPIDADDFFPRLWQFATRLDEVNGPTATLGVAALAVMLLLKWRLPSAPSALIGVVLATAVAAMLSLEQHGVAMVGSIPAGLPTPSLPDVSLHDLALLLPVAAGIALVGFTDNVLTARAIASRKGYRIEPNQELLALGLTNLTSGLSQGFPLSSSASRTAVPASLGSRTQLVSLVAAAFVVASLLFARPLLAEIPRTALAAVILMAAATIIDVSGFVSLWRVSRAECVLAVVATTGVVVLGVLYGIVIAVALSIAVALANIARPHDAVLGDMPDGSTHIAGAGGVSIRRSVVLRERRALQRSCATGARRQPGRRGVARDGLRRDRRARRIGGRDAGRVDRPSANGGGGGHRGGASERAGARSPPASRPAPADGSGAHVPHHQRRGAGVPQSRIVKPFTRHAVG